MVEASVRGMNPNDIPVDEKPAQASSGLEVRKDNDGAHVSDDGDGEVPPVTSADGGSNQQNPISSSDQLQVGKADRDMQDQPKTNTKPSGLKPDTHLSTAGLSSNVPIEVVTVSSMPAKSDFDAGSRTLSSDQPDSVPSRQPRVDSYESLERAFKDGTPFPSQGIAVASSQSQQDTPSSSRAGSEPPGMPPISAPPGMPPTAHANSPTSTASSSGSWHNKSKQVSSLRRGKWTSEEEAYVARVIQDFNSGFLDAPAGTTLRTYLSEKLQCDPMRITKKFTGDACIGKRVFHPSVRSPSNAASIDKAQVSNIVDCCWRLFERALKLTRCYLCFLFKSELDGLEQRWRRRLEMQLRDHAKKAAASVAAAAAATGRPAGMLLDDQVAGSDQNMVSQTASWLDRAKVVLQDPSPDTPGQEKSEEDEDEIMTQMQEVERLIHEGPSIQQTSVGLTNAMDSQGTASSPPVLEPADKRLRTGAEDAEALVGFLRSVRASAASGED
jgi:hypothetical protein